MTNPPTRPTPPEEDERKTRMTSDEQRDDEFLYAELPLSKKNREGLAVSRGVARVDR